jgi:hypothetical protein
VRLRCEFRAYTGDDPVGFVISMNLRRRHPADSQRAMTAARLANVERGQFAGNQHVPSANLQTPVVTQAKGAELLNVSPRSVAQAVKVLRQAAPAACVDNIRGHFSRNGAIWPKVNVRKFRSFRTRYSGVF